MTEKAQVLNLCPKFFRLDAEGVALNRAAAADDSMARRFRYPAMLQSSRPVFQEEKDRGAFGNRMIAAKKKTAARNREGIGRK